jgi:hypothetical protein
LLPPISAGFPLAENRHEVGFPAVEQNAGAVMEEGTESATIIFQPLDFRVEPFCDRVGDWVPSVGEQVILKTEMRTTDFSETTENEDERKSKGLTHWVNPFEAESLSVTHLFLGSYPCPCLKSVVVPPRI